MFMSLMNALVSLELSGRHPETSSRVSSIEILKNIFWIEYKIAMNQDQLHVKWCALKYDLTAYAYEEFSVETFLKQA